MSWASLPCFTERKIEEVICLRPHTYQVTELGLDSWFSGVTRCLVLDDMMLLPGHGERRAVLSKARDGSRMPPSLLCACHLSVSLGPG